MSEKRKPRKEVRGNDGRFQPGHQPPKSPGRPKGNPVRKTAYRKAVDIVENLLGKSHMVLEEHLEQTTEVAVINPMTGEPEVDANGVIVTKMVGGDPRVAMWVIERMIPKDDSGLPKDMEVDLSNMEGVVEAAQQAVEWVCSRQLTIEKGQKMLNLLLTFAQMKAYDHINELRELVQDFEKQATQGGEVIDGSLVPQWGRLAEKIEARRQLTETSPTANVEPAE